MSEEYPSLVTAETISLRIVEAYNLGSLAELASLRAERARLTLQIDEAGIKPGVVRALHPSAVVVPTVILACEECAVLRYQLRMAKLLAATEHRKREAAHRRYLAMTVKQEEYRRKIYSLQKIGRRSGK